MLYDRGAPQALVMGIRQTLGADIIAQSVGYPDRPMVTISKYKIYLLMEINIFMYSRRSFFARSHAYSTYPPGNARHDSTYLPQHRHLWSPASLCDTGNAGTPPGRMARWPAGRGRFRVVSKHLS